MLKKLQKWLLLAAMLVVPWVTQAQTHYVLTVGSGTATSPYVPSYGYYNYSYTQSLYTAGEVGLDGDIDTIAFEVSSGSATRSINVYMAEVSRTSFPTTSNAVPGADFHLVYSGSVSWSAGWVTIALDSIFTYSDTGSLAIAVTDGGSWASGYPYFTGTQMTDNRSLYSYNDNSAYSLSSALNNTSTFLPNIRLGISSYSSYCAAPSNVTISGIHDDEATISWHENGTATSYELIVSESLVSDFSTATSIYVNDTTYTITGLLGNAPYYVYVRADCGSNEYSAWTAAATFRSACAGSTVLPYSTGFEDLATAQLPNCWVQVAQGSSSASTFPAAYAYAPNARNSNVYFEFESSTGETEIAALPAMDNINTLQFSFYASLMNSNFTFEVGVMEDTAFVPVDTVALTPGSGGNWSGSYYPYTVYFDQYTGSGDRIAMRVTASGSYTLMMDDFVVMEIPNCFPPSNLAVDSLSNSWVAMSWHDNASANGWEVLYATTDFNPDTVTASPIVAYDTALTITGLTSGTTYYAYVRADCGDYSPWAGPLTFTPGQYNMRYSGSDTVRSCGLVIYDDGGPDQEYTTGADFTLVVYPSDDDSVVTCWGSYDIYGYYARLRIYEGVGTNGAPIWQTNQSDYSGTIPFIRSNAGALTIRYVAGSYNYGYNGFELFTGCAAAPECAVLTDLTTTSVGTGSAFITWNVAGRQFGDPVSYEIECTDLGTTATTTQSATTTNATITGLTANTNYRIRVRPECDGTVYGAWDSIDITTLHLPCMQYDTALADTVLISGDGPSTAYTIPVNNYYNYSYTQQLIGRDELTGATVISGIDFEYGYGSPNSDETNCTIYLAHTNYTSLNDDFMPYDSSIFVRVYSGPLICQNGWNHFDFDTTFTYNGTDNLLVAVLDNSGDYNGSSYVFNGHTVSGLARHIYTDNSPYNIETVSGGYTSTFRSNMRLHIAGCTQLLSCGRPIVMVDSVGSDFINLSWAPGYQETSWGVEYMSEDDTVWTSEGTTTSTSYSFTNLNTDTRYYFRITANCTDTLMYTQLTARTICLPATLPFTYGFETYPYSGQAPSCWYSATTYEWGTYPAPSSSYAHTGSQSIYLYSSSGTHTYLALPVLAAALDSVELTFWLLKSDNYDQHEVSVGVMSDPEDFNTFVPVTAVTASAVNTWEPITVRFNNYTGNGQNITFATTDDAYSGPYIDDIVIDYIRPCPRLENVTASNITSTDATITWNGAGNTSFELVYGPSGFAIDSGTVITASTDTVVISGLTPNTPYDVYVRTFCASGDTSNWSNQYIFRTNCMLIDSIPFTESFESLPSGWGNYNSPNFYPCWNRHINASDDSYYPYVDTYGGHTGSNYLYWYWSDYYNTDHYLVLPGIDTTAIPFSDLQLNFWARSNSSYADYPIYIIGVMTDQHTISTFQPVDTVVVTNDNWFLYETPLNSYTGNGIYIAIKTAPTTPNEYWYGDMDDISLVHIPSCSHVTDLAVTGNTATSVSLDWSEGGSATTWEIAVDTLASATPVADTTIIDSTSATIGGLTSGTYYYFWVRAICGAGDTSDWEGPVLGIPNVWMMRPNQTDTLVMCGGIIYDDGGPLNAYANNQTSTVILMPNDANSLVSVSGSSYTESTYDYITIYDGIGTSGTQFWSDYGVSSYQTFGPFISSSGPITIAFHSDGSVTYDGFEVNVNCISTHCRVTNAQLDTLIPQSPSQLAITWNDNGAILYEVEYDTTGFTQGNGTTLYSTTNSIVIPGLSSLGVYDVYIRSICGVGDTGDWSLYHFQTAFCDGMNVAENWAHSGSSSTTSYGPIGYSCYNYSYTQVIIDSADLAALNGDITAFGFQPSNSASYGSYYTHMDIYMANISESTLSGFIHPDTTHHFVQVMTDGNCTFSNNDWQLIPLDTAFTWDGHSNVLFAVNRKHGTYACSANFTSHSATGSKMAFAYNDNSSYNINTATASDLTSNVGDLRLFSCNGTACPQPVITSVANTYEDATVTWSGNSTNYEVNVKESIATSWPATDIAVTGNTYTFTGLQPATSYTFRVRQDCTADSLGYSEWTVGSFTTDSMPCLTPDSLHVTAVTNATATFDWAPVGTETAWQLHVWYSGGIDSLYTVATRPATVGGFTANTTYQAAVLPLCGSAHNIVGDWGDTITFTTAVCPNVTGLTASNVTSNSVELHWAADPMAQSWIIEYGYQGFDQGTGTMATSSTNSYTVSGLLDDMAYDFLVRAVCGDDWQSEGVASVTATTHPGAVTCDAPTSVNAVVAGNAATVSWMAGAGNISFQVEYGTRGFAHGGGNTITANASPVTLTGLDYETEYDVYVKAYCGDNIYSAWSAVVSFTTEPEGSQDCDPVTDLAASNITENSALLTWTPGTTGDEWEVVLTDASGVTVSEASTTERQYMLDGLTPGTAYIAKVRTVCGDEQYSTFVSTSFTTLTVGIDKVEDATCAIYPNPTSGATTIRITGITGKVRIAVIDMNGREVAIATSGSNGTFGDETLDCSGDCAKTMDVDRLAQGAYFVRITGENVSMVKKLIVR